MSTPRSCPVTRRGALGAAVLAAAALLAGCASGPRASGTSGGQYSFWPIAPAEPRVQFLYAFSTSADVAPPRGGGFERLVFGAESEEDAPIRKPYGVHMWRDRIYVCDIRRRALVVLDLKAKQTRLVGSGGLNRLGLPVDVAVAEDGTIYVADKDRSAIVVFDRRERFLTALGHPDFTPIGVAVHGDRLYVCNMATQRVEILDRGTGALLGNIGEPGDEDGQFRVPLGVDVDADGNIHVVDVMRCRLQTFSPEGELLAAVGEMGDIAGTFARPKHIAVDEDGISYVIDAAFQNVQMFDAAHRLLMHFGSAGNHPGAMNLPAGVAVLEGGVELFKDRLHPGFEARRLILVTNQFGPNKVAVYALGGLRPGWSVADLSASAADVSLGVSEAEGPASGIGPADEPLPEDEGVGSPGD